MEIWANIIGEYFVSDLGNVKRKNRLLKKEKDKNGYEYVNISINGIVKHHSVHKLVALAFIPNPFNFNEINHINGITCDNRVENLEWVNHKQNMHHARINGLISKQGIQRTINAMTNSTKKSIRQLKNGFVVKEYESIAKASKETNIKAPHICNVLKGKRKSAGGYEWEYV